ncbi:hypothetical protein M2169_006365 [Streptomyces sp. MJP52]|nr:hypothetical protein [Streptomyces sp. MJP52]
MAPGGGQAVRSPSVSAGPAGGAVGARTPSAWRVHGSSVSPEGPRVHADGAQALRVGGAHGHLDGDAAPLGQDQGVLQGEFADLAAARLVAGGDGEFDERGAGQQGGAQDDVVGEPGVGLHGQEAGEQHAVALGEADRGAEQGVLGGALADGGDVPAPAGGQLGPVATVLEGVGGQGDGAGAGPLVEGLPVDLGAADVEFGERRSDRPVLGAVLAQGGHERGVRPDAVAADRAERAAGADLQVGGDAEAVEGAQSVGEPDGLAHVPHPVAGAAQFVGGEDVAGEVGDDGEAGLVVGEGGGDPGELVQHGVHVRRVEGVADPQPLGLREAFREGQHLVLVAGDDHGVRAVEGGDGHVLGEQGQDLVLGRLDGDHRPAPRQGLHQPTAGRDQGGRVLQGPDARDVCGGEFADGVAEEVVGGDAPVLHQPEQGDLDGEQAGLGVDGPVQQVRLRVEHQFLEGPVQVLVEFRADRVEGLREHRVGLVQLASHAGALRPLAREQEGQPAVFQRVAAEHGRGGGAVGDGAQPVEQFVAAGAEEGDPQVEGGAGDGGGPGDVQDAGRLGLQAGEEAGGLLGDGLLGVAGQQPGGSGRGPHRAGRVVAGGAGVVGRGLLDDGVRVGAADAERGDREAARLTGLRPGARLGEQFDVARGPVDVRGRPVDVEGPGQHAVAHRHDHLDDAGDARGGLGVAEVRLQGAQPQRAAFGPVLAVRGEQRLRLDRVAQPGARAVGLHGVDLRGGQARVRQRLADDALLGRPVGGGQAVAGAVLVDGRTPDDREDLMAVAAGVRQPLQQHQADALRPAGAVGGVGERLAAAVGRQAPLAAELDEHARRGHHRHAARDGEGALALAQRLRRQVDGDQGRGARGVDRDRRALQAEGVADAARDDAAGGAGQVVALDALGEPEQRRVVLAGRTREHADRTAAQRGRGHAGPLEQLPGALQQQPLLRVHGERLAGADVEQRRVEVAGRVEEPARGRVGRAPLVGVGVVEALQVPAAVLGEAGDRVPALVDQPPQVLRRPDAAGEAAGHGDDGDRLVLPRLQFAQPLPGLVEVRGHPLQVLEDLLVIRHAPPASPGIPYVRQSRLLRPLRTRCR